MPFALPASSATDLPPLPATNAVMEPPSFVPAVMAASDATLSLPSFASRMASVEANRAHAACDCVWRSCARADRSTEVRAAANMVGSKSYPRASLVAWLEECWAGWLDVGARANSKSRVHAAETNDLGPGNVDGCRLRVPALTLGFELHASTG